MTPAGFGALLEAVSEVARTVDTTSDDAWLLLERIHVVRVDLADLAQRIRVAAVNNTPLPKSPPRPPAPPAPPATPPSGT